MSWDSLITVGRIVRPHGHRGAVVVEPETDFAAERFRPGSELQWRPQDTVAPVRIASSREYRRRWVVTLEGVTTMNEAEALRGLELRVPAEALHPLEAGAHYVHDLEGCEVVTSAGDRVGRVTGVQFGSGAPLLVIAEPADAQGGEVLVPLVEGIIQVVDAAAKRIVIDPPAGLVDLNRMKAKAR
jgi:16S rRNA processing protein RimM